MAGAEERKEGEAGAKAAAAEGKKGEGGAGEVTAVVAPKGIEEVRASSMFVWLGFP